MAKRRPTPTDSPAPGESIPLIAVPVAPGGGPKFQIHVLIGAITVALALLAHGRSISGAFVYDDNFEIVQNHLIQDPRFLWTGVTSDVWAFKGARDRAWSNYWRPVIVLTKSMCFHLFGLNPTGWHVVCVALHTLASLLGYAVARRIGLSIAAAAGAAWLFAAHPAHVESVAWIAAIPDPLMTCFLFGSYLCYLRAREAGPRAVVALVAAVGLYLLGQGCKEAAIVYPVIVLLTELLLPRRAGLIDAAPVNAARVEMARALPTGAALKARGLEIVRLVGPFFGAALVFVIARQLILKQARIIPPGAPSLDAVLLSAPLLLTFYLRQMFLPLALAPMYGLRVVTATGGGFSNLGLPALALLAAVGLAGVLVRRRITYRIALLWLVFPILLPLDVRVFLPEDVVHDRYLYLSIFGAMLVLAQVIEELCVSLSRRPVVAQPQRAAAIVMLLAATAAAGRAWAYTPVWGSDIAMWEAAVASDPESAKAWTELGENYRRVQRFDDAERALAQAARLNPNVTNQRISAAMLLIERGKLAEAEAELRRVIAVYPDYATAVEQLAVVLNRQRRFDDAIAVFDEGRRRMPFKRGQYAVNIAVLHKLAGRPERALRELEENREALAAAAATDAATLNGWHYLGELYREAGRTDEALAAHREFLARTANLPATEDLKPKRRASEAAVKALSPP